MSKSIYTVCLYHSQLITIYPPQINTVRVYNLDPAANHDDCVSIFNAVGMYMVLDVNSPLSNGALSRTDPGASYNKVYMEHVFSVIEAFKDYPNLLGLFAGNEVINEQAVIQVPAYIRVRRTLTKTGNQWRIAVS